MTIFLTIVAFLIIFSLLIIIHELGHFYMAKRAGIKVEEFGFGLPPKIWGKKKGDTLYSLNLIPFGGFVRLYGEDPTQKGALTAPNSFVSKSLWQKTKVVLGGVFMNFVLAILLFTIGYTFGIEPFIVNYDQFKEAVTQNKVIVYPYPVVKESILQKVETGDVLLQVDNVDVQTIKDIPDFVSKLESPIDLKIRRYSQSILKNDEFAVARGSIEKKINLTVKEFQSLKFFNTVTLARPVMQSDASEFGLLAGDEIMRLNDEIIVDVDQLLNLLTRENVDVLYVLRGSQVIKVTPTKQIISVFVDDVLTDSVAYKAGVKVGDEFLRIGEQAVYTPNSVREITHSLSDQSATDYIFMRDGNEVIIPMTPQNGLIGTALGFRANFHNFDLAEKQRPISLLEVKKEQVSPVLAPFKAVDTVFEISKLTFVMMGKMFMDIFSTGNVPDEVSGPVGIAQMTYVSVQNGVMDVIRFAAILSLSLGVLNVLPFPALDGGRFFFIAVEALFGKKITYKFESTIHAFGFVLLLLLIVFITYNDIAKIL